MKSTPLDYHIEDLDREIDDLKADIQRLEESIRNKKVRLAELYMELEEQD